MKQNIPENPEFTEMRPDDIILTLQLRHESTGVITDPRAVSVRLFVFYLSDELVRVCEMKLSQMGESNENPDLACEKERKRELTDYF